MEELQDLEANENDEKEAKLKENVESKLLLKTSKIV
jgi:hypothetical protein